MTRSDKRGVLQVTTTVVNTDLVQRKIQPQPPVNIKDYVLYTTCVVEEDDPKILGLKSDFFSCEYPLSDYLNCDRFLPSHRALLAAITSGVEPKSFQEAM